MPQDLYPKKMRLSDDSKAHLYEEDSIKFLKRKGTWAIRGARVTHGFPFNQTRFLIIIGGAPNKIMHNIVNPITQGAGKGGSLYIIGRNHHKDILNQG